MNVQSLSRPIVLRSTTLRNFLWLCAVGSLVMFSLTALAGPGPDPEPIDYIGTTLMGVVLALAFARGTRMHVKLDDDGVTVVGYYVTRKLQWDEVADLSVDYYGMRFIKTDGSVVTATSLGRANWAKWMNVQTAADDRLRIALQMLEVHRRLGTT